MKEKNKKYNKPELKIHGNIIKITNDVGQPPFGDGGGYGPS